MRIEPCTSVDPPGWLALRSALWPHASRDEHLAEMAAFLAEPARFAQWLAHDDAPLGEATGLVEASIRRDYVNGTEHSPVLFLEGLYVAPAWRRRGVARRLVEAAAAWGEALGCREFASDAAIDNLASHALHRALGFEETERVVYFRRRLGGG